MATRQGYTRLKTEKLYLMLIFIIVVIIGGYIGQYIHQKGDSIITHDISLSHQATVSLVGSTTDTISSTVLSRASGIIISPDGLVLTAKHALISGAVYDITTYDQQHYTVSHIWYDPHRDLAVLQIRDDSGLKPRKLPFVSLPSTSSIATESIITLGYDDAKLVSLTGTIVGYHDGMYEITSHLSPGMSGGPLMTSDGRLGGINISVSMRNADQSFALAVDQEIIQGFLGKNTLL